jgi:hypothetical protein
MDASTEFETLCFIVVLSVSMQLSRTIFVIIAAYFACLPPAPGSAGSTPPANAQRLRDGKASARGRALCAAAVLGRPGRQPPFERDGVPGGPRPGAASQRRASVPSAVPAGAVGGRWPSSPSPVPHRELRTKRSSSSFQDCRVSLSGRIPSTFGLPEWSNCTSRHSN